MVDCCRGAVRNSCVGDSWKVSDNGDAAGTKPRLPPITHYVLILRHQIALDTNLKEYVKRYLETTVALSESLGPIVSACAFGWSYGMGTRFPMDATFFFNICFVLSIGQCFVTVDSSNKLCPSGLYTASLVLRIEVRDDSGTVPEGTLVNGTDSRWSDKLGDGNDSFSHSFRCPSSRRCPGMNCLEEILIIPATDMSALIVDVTEAAEPSLPDAKSA